MGNSESVMRLVGALGQPCAGCWHDLNVYCLDECTSDCAMGESCCKLHVETHHTEDYPNSDEESGDENVGA